MRTIYYFCPDFSPPSGGTKRLYRHVYQLNQMGIKASIVHQKSGFLLSWHGFQVPVVWLEHKPPFEREDILVFPEGMASLMKQTQHFPCPRVAIALNWSYVYLNLPKGENWKDYGIERAITPSPLIKDFLEWSMGLEVTLIHNYVDTDRYSYQPDKKMPKIAYMSRKDLSGEILRCIFEKKNGAFSDYEWVHLKDLAEEEYAWQLTASRIFLATSPQEGMPTSALEAMAAGCLVIGFSGVGGNDYLIGNGDRQNCFLVENGNYIELGRELERLILQWENDKTHFDSVVRNGIETVRQFEDFDKEASSLKHYFQSLG